MIEEEATRIGNTKVKTLNCDIFSRMVTSSMKTFKQFNFHNMYSNIPDADIILDPFNHSRHWCLVIIDLVRRRSIYIDSLYEGIGANVAFIRMNNFLTCCKTTMTHHRNMKNGSILLFQPQMWHSKATVMIVESFCQMGRTCSHGTTTRLLNHSGTLSSWI